MNYRKFNLNELFKIARGDFHISAILDIGTIPLISCSTENNGTEGFFDIPSEKRYSNALTIASDGKPLTTFYHNYEFGAKDNVVVCLPLSNLSEKTMRYIASKINAQSWRFSYGRKCYLNKLDKIKFSLPVNNKGDIDLDYINNFVKDNIKNTLPKKNNIKKEDYRLKFKRFYVTDFFELERGDFHSIDSLDSGAYPTVSRDTLNNGIVGFYDKPKNAKIYPKFTITISTVSGDAFLQLKEFIATDNVLMCIPKSKLRKTTIFFIQAMINKAKWRYSYGRQCYKRVFGKTEIYLPIQRNDSLNEDIIEEIVKNTSYWNYLKKFI